jgi:hypothetical protein
MKISPYLESILKKWGNDTKRLKPWYTESPYIKEFIGKTDRSNRLNLEMDDSEKLGQFIGSMSESLRRSLDAMYRHNLKTDKFRAEWCRCSKREYKAHFWEAIGKLESFIESKIAI